MVKTNNLKNRIKVYYKTRQFILMKENLGSFIFHYGNKFALGMCVFLLGLAYCLDYFIFVNFIFTSLLFLSGLILGFFAKDKARKRMIWILIVINGLIIITLLFTGIGFDLESWYNKNWEGVYFTYIISWQGWNLFLGFLVVPFLYSLAVFGIPTYIGYIIRYAMFPEEDHTSKITVCTICNSPNLSSSEFCKKCGKKL